MVAGATMSLLTLNLALHNSLPYQPGQLLIQEVPLIAAGGFIGGLFPDIDIHKSKAGQATGAVSLFIEKTFGHRTMFHSPIFYMLLALAAFKLISGDWVYWFMIPFMLGVASHLLLDMCNRAGIPLFYPIKKRFHIMSAESDGPVEKLTRVLGICLLFALTANLVVQATLISKGVISA